MSDHATDLPHMLPAPDEFRRAMSARWASAMATWWWSMTAPALFSAARVWWMLRVMGHDKVAVLDGGLPKWKAEGRALENGAAAPKPAHFTASPVAGQVRDFADVKAALGNTQILDARSNRRFTGAEKEPRPGVRIRPYARRGQCALPQPCSTPTARLKDDDELQKLFAEKGVDLRAPIITTCGSGVTAAILMLALAQIGRAQTSLYDGSWAEWGGTRRSPVVADRMSAG